MEKDSYDVTVTAATEVTVSCSVIVVARGQDDDGEEAGTLVGGTAVVDSSTVEGGLADAVGASVVTMTVLMRSTLIVQLGNTVARLSMSAVGIGSLLHPWNHVGQGKVVKVSVRAEMPLSNVTVNGNSGSAVDSDVGSEQGRVWRVGSSVGTVKNVGIMGSLFSRRSGSSSSGSPAASINRLLRVGVGCSSSLTISINRSLSATAGCSSSFSPCWMTSRDPRAIGPAKQTETRETVALRYGRRILLKVTPWFLMVGHSYQSR